MAGGSATASRRGYAVLHPCAPAAGIVLVIGIVAHVFIFILGRLDPEASSASRPPDRLTHHREIIETGNESWRFKR